MSCRGVFFALTDEQASRLLAAASDEERLFVVQDEIEEAWDADWLQECDKTWDAMHRCLAGGEIARDGEDPLACCVLGGTDLYGGDDYIVSLKSPGKVRAVSASLQAVSKRAFARRYDLIVEQGYDGPASIDDLESTWAYFEDVRSFYEKAAADGRAVIFTVDQ